MIMRMLLVPVLLTGLTLAVARGQEAKTKVAGDAKAQGNANVGQTDAKAGAAADAKANTNAQPGHANAAANANMNANIHVLARGPIHEAFARPFERNPSIPRAVHRQPPQRLVEEIPAMRPAGDNVRWIPGYWDWDRVRNDFTWVSGVWRKMPDERRWVMGYWAQAQDGWHRVSGHFAAKAEQDFQIVTQPPASLETGAVAKASESAGIHIPGSWQLTEQGYQWRAGYFTEFKNGMVWEPARYDWTAQGWSYTSGYWDVAPLNRGVMFAPLAVDNTAALNAALTVRPMHVLSTASVFDNLFVGLGTGNYFFGDLYGQGGLALGFQPWLQFAAENHDALFGYLSVAKSSGLTLNDLQAHLNARLSGQLGAPPITLDQQTKLAAAALGANANAATQASALIAPLADTKLNGAALVNVSDQDRASINTNVQTMVDQSLQRASAAAQVGVNANMLGVGGLNTAGGLYSSGYFAPGVPSLGYQGQVFGQGNYGLGNFSRGGFYGGNALRVGTGAVRVGGIGARIMGGVGAVGGLAGGLGGIGGLIR
jgi:hypothetical protein